MPQKLQKFSIIRVIKYKFAHVASLNMAYEVQENTPQANNGSIKEGLF